MFLKKQTRIVRVSYIVLFSETYFILIVCASLHGHMHAYARTHMHIYTFGDAMLTLELSGVVSVIVCRLCTPHSRAPWKLAAVVTVLSVSITERLDVPVQRNVKSRRWEGGVL